MKKLFLVLIMMLLNINLIAQSVTTEEYLAKYNLSKNDARNFILNNIDNLQVIYDVCLEFGVNNDMIADILSSDFPGLSGIAVKNYFNTNGFNGIALGFNGSSQDIELNDYAQTGYPVHVERGKVYGALVSDYNGNIATQLNDNQNTYIFDSPPVFPVTAEGGWIDVNDDKQITQEDIALNIKMVSHNNNITPVSTYIADSNAETRKQRLNELKALTGLEAFEMLSLPSKQSEDGVFATNAIFELLVEKDQTKKDLSLENITERFNQLKQKFPTDIDKDKGEFAKDVEKNTIEELKSKGLIEELSKDDIEKIKTFKFNTIEKELSEDSKEDTNSSSSDSSDETSSDSDEETSSVSATDDSTSDATLYDVTMESFGASKLNVVKAVKEITGLGLKEAKELTESVPTNILEAVLSDEASEALSYLEEAGATAYISESGETDESSETSTDSDSESSSESTSDDTLYTVTMESFGESKVSVIKAVKEITGLGLKEAKDLVESVPTDVIDDLAYDEASVAVSYLEEAGATAYMTVDGEEVDSSDSSTDSSSEESSEAIYSVKLESHGDSKLNVVKLVKELTGLGLKEAKELVDSAPSTILEELTYDEASSIATQLEEAGATVSIEGGDASSDSSTDSTDSSGESSTDTDSLYDVYLSSFGDSKVNTIKAIKTITGLGLKEAKDLVESAPTVVLENVSSDDADSAVDLLEEAGATAYSESTGVETESTEDEETETDTNLYTVTLEDIGDNKLNVVKAVKSITGLGLKEAKDLVDTAPNVVLENVAYDEANVAAGYLEEAGATVSMEVTG